MTVHNTVHTITVRAPADAVYALISDVEVWPHLFPPTIHATRVDAIDATDGTGAVTHERIRIWARAGGGAKTWTSRRTLRPAERYIEFRQEIPASPVAAMGGTWKIVELGPDRCEVRLTHHYRAIDDKPEHVEWIGRAVEQNSTSELAALKESVETLVAGGTQELLTFADSVTIDGSVEDVYDFLNDAKRWSERLPHVARVQLTEDSPGLQQLEMDTRTKDGSMHTTVSIRVCLPPDRIVYKQITLPALLALHTGSWEIKPADEGGLLVTSRHDVLINTANIATVLGPDRSLDDARAFVQGALSANSLATLKLAKKYAESPS